MYRATCTHTHTHTGTLSLWKRLELAGAYSVDVGVVQSCINLIQDKERSWLVAADGDSSLQPHYRQTVYPLNLESQNGIKILWIAFLEARKASL